MDEPKPLGGMGYQEALDSAGQKISKISSDVEKMAKWAESFAKSMKEAAAASKAIASASKQTTGSGPNKGAGNTGSGKDQGMQTGEVSDGGGPSQFAKMAWGLAGFTGKAAIAGINDVRIGATTALQYEQARYLGRTGGADYAKFRGMVDRAANDFNVQDRTIFAQDIGFTLNQGYGELFGGGSLGQQKATAAMGGMHSLARNAGLAPEAAKGAMNTLYGAEAHYSAMAAGIFTVNPVTGENYTPEQIVDQYMQGRLKGKSAEEIRRWSARGRIGQAELLEVTQGDTELAEMLRQGMILSAESGGGSLAEGSIEAYMKQTGRAGGKGTQGMDSMSMLQGAEMSRIGDYTTDITNGIATANGLLTDLNKSLTDLTGPMRDLVAAIETSGGFMDTMNNVLPKSVDLFTTAISAAMGWMASKLMGGGGGGGDGSGSAVAGGKKGGFKGFLKGAGRFAGRAALPVAALTAGVAATEWAGNNLSGDTWDATDTMGTIAAYAGTGAMFGTVLPGVGNVVGAVGGAIIGGLVGVGRSISRSNADSDYQSSSSTTSRAQSGRPRYAEGEWFVESDKTADIHQGEMIIPARVAQAVRDELSRGKKPSDRSGAVVNITVNVQRASEAEAVRLARMVKRSLHRDDELTAIGDGRLIGPMR